MTRPYRVLLDVRAGRAWRAELDALAGWFPADGLPVMAADAWDAAARVRAAYRARPAWGLREVHAGLLDVYPLDTVGGREALVREYRRRRLPAEVIAGPRLPVALPEAVVALHALTEAIRAGRATPGPSPALRPR